MPADSRAQAPALFRLRAPILGSATIEGRSDCSVLLQGPRVRILTVSRLRS